MLGEPGDNGGYSSEMPQSAGQVCRVCDKIEAPALGAGTEHPDREIHQGGTGLGLSDISYCLIGFSKDNE